MAQSLGSIYVELNANTAKFVDAMSKAAYVAQTSARNISKEFASLQRVASQTFGAFGAMNPAISQVTFALSSASRAAADAMKSFGAMGGAVGAVASITAGATAALASVAAGATALAMHTAESAAKLYEQSQATGVSIEALSALSFAAKQSGVATESMVTGLERMSRSAFAAANAPVGTINAYSRLGIAVKDSSGQMRSAESIFADIAGRFAAMADGPAKTALAIQLFGRSGAELIPILNQGRAGIEDYIATAQRLGIVISGETGEAAERFEKTLGLLGAAATGAEVRLMQDLLPSLQAIATALTATSDNGESTLSNIAHWTAELVKGTLGVLNTWMHGFEQVGIVIEALGRTIQGSFKAIDALLKTEYQISIFDFSGAEASAREGVDALTSTFTDFWAESKKNWQDNADFINGLTFRPDYSLTLSSISGPQGGGFTAGQDFLKRTRPHGALEIGTGAVGSGANAKDTIADLITKLEAQTAAELALAGATNLSAAALVMQKSAGEADIKIAETRSELLDREKSLQAELDDARANQKGPAAARLEAEIAGVKKLVAELSADVPTIRILYQELAAAQEFTRVGGEMSKEGLGFDRQVASIQELVAAYQNGGAAIASADIDKQLEEDKQRVSELMELLARVNATDPFNFPALSELMSSLANANAQLEQNRAKLQQIRSLNIDADIAKQSDAFRREAAAITVLNDAYLRNAAAVRSAQVGVDVAKFKTQNPGASPEQTAAFADLVRSQGALAIDTDVAKQTYAFREETAAIIALNDAYLQNAAAVRSAQIGVDIAKFKTENPGADSGQVAAFGDLVREQEQRNHSSEIAKDASQYVVGYDEQISKLREVKEAIQATGQSTLLVDAEIHDANQRLIDQWDQAAMKVGTLGDRFKAMFQEIQTQGQDFGGKVFESLTKSIDDVSGELAKMVVTGKSNFLQLFQSLEEQILKASFQKTIGSIVGALTGGGNSQDGANAKPWNEQPPGTAGSPAGGILGSIGKAIGVKAPGGSNKGAGPTGAPGDPIYVAMSSSSGDMDPLKDALGGGKNDAPFNFKLPGLSTPSGSDSSGLGFGGMDFGSLLDQGPAAPGAGSGGGGFLSSLTGLFSKMGGGLTSILSSIGGGIASGAGAIFSSIASIFGGFLASGGDVTPGKAYVVGEKHPEFFVPKQAGRVAPSMQMGSAGGHQSTVNMHFHGVQDADSFRRSQTQIYASMHAQLALANSRNG